MSGEYKAPLSGEDKLKRVVDDYGDQTNGVNTGVFWEDVLAALDEHRHATYCQNCFHQNSVALAKARACDALLADAYVRLDCLSGPARDAVVALRKLQESK